MERVHSASQEPTPQGHITGFCVFEKNTKPIPLRPEEKPTATNPFLLVAPNS